MTHRANQSEVDDISSKLKFVAKIQPDQRVNVNNCLSLHDKNSWSIRFWRTYKGNEGRHATYEFVKELIDRAYELLSSLRHSISDYDLEVYKKIVTELIQIEPGLRNLTKTYHKDDEYITTIETLIDSLKIKIRELCDYKNIDSVALTAQYQIILDETEELSEAEEATEKKKINLTLTSNGSESSDSDQNENDNENLSENDNENLSENDNLSDNVNDSLRDSDEWSESDNLSQSENEINADDSIDDNTRPITNDEVLEEMRKSIPLLNWRDRVAYGVINSGDDYNVCIGKGVINSGDDYNVCIGKADCKYECYETDCKVASKCNDSSDTSDTNDTNVTSDTKCKISNSDYDSPLGLDACVPPLRHTDQPFGLRKANSAAVDQPFGLRKANSAAVATTQLSGHGPDQPFGLRKANSAAVDRSDRAVTPPFNKFSDRLPKEESFVKLIAKNEIENESATQKASECVTPKAPEGTSTKAPEAFTPVTKPSKLPPIETDEALLEILNKVNLGARRRGKRRKADNQSPHQSPHQSPPQNSTPNPYGILKYDFSYDLESGLQPPRAPLVRNSSNEIRGVPLKKKVV